jgi:thymidylate kinase
MKLVLDLAQLQKNRMMDLFLPTIGFRLDPAGGAQRKLYVIDNPDGTARWIWNADNPKPDFLRFYATSSFRSQIFTLAIRVLFIFKLQHLIFGRKSLSVHEDAAHPLHPYTRQHFALFTGTEGPNRKLVVFARGQFLKIALDHTSAALIEREKNSLLQIGPGRHFLRPEAASIGTGILALSDLSSGGVRMEKFSALHARALAEIGQQKDAPMAVFSETKAFRQSLAYLQEQQTKQPSAIPHFLQEKLQTLSIALKDGTIKSTWAHRDFTPWNCYIHQDKIALYDFELAQDRMPFAFDAFHFVMQQGILVDRTPWKDLQPKMRAAFDLLCEETQTDKSFFDSCLKAYLFVNISYYLHIYSRQERWHTQISWLLNTWNDALSDVLSGQEVHRELLLGDVFDFLMPGDYAALKFPDIHPKSLSDYADVDLLMTKPLAKRLALYLQQHSLVEKVSLQEQSHMLSLLLVLKDGGVLAFDLIWQLKRKAVVFMNVSDAIRGSALNHFGIKVADHHFVRNYLRFFYGLNHSEIPGKHLHYFDEENLPAFSPAMLAQQAALLPDNHGLPGFLNKLRYGLDLCRRIFRKRGVIITFSGVDGAGKSTIIEHTKLELEKKWRKRVVVIRHRPSLFPILSAFSYGKKEAEQRAANTLPRQGGNKSLVSSALRFAYYYTDYLLGQFYIYVRHILAGHVVLYDRYYFDFINDSLRSNIILPKWLTKAGYKLLMQPHLNFFLYAQPSVILERKKELDAAAIEQLTSDYLGLFSELGSRSKDKYFPIENLQMQQTLSFISAKTRTKLL